MQKVPAVSTRDSNLSLRLSKAMLTTGPENIMSCKNHLGMFIKSMEIGHSEIFQKALTNNICGYHFIHFKFLAL